MEYCFSWVEHMVQDFYGILIRLNDVFNFYEDVAVCLWILFNNI